MIKVWCDHCGQQITDSFPAGVVVRLGKKCEYRFHLCEEHMQAFEGRMSGFLTHPPRSFSVKQ